MHAEIRLNRQYTKHIYLLEINVTLLFQREIVADATADSQAYFNRAGDQIRCQTSFIT